MELRGEIVRHKTFGRGQIVSFANNYVTVLFDDSKIERKFGYPTVFGKFLELENQSFEQQIQQDKDVISVNEAENKRINDERLKLEVFLNSKESKIKRTKKTTTKKTTTKKTSKKVIMESDLTSI